MLKGFKKQLCQLPDGAPAYVEVDETCVSTWRSRGEGEAEGSWTWCVGLGILQRGNPMTLWLKPMPLTTSRRKPRVSQLKTDEHLALAEAKFSEANNAVLFNDSAVAFVNTNHPGINQKVDINHSERVWTRSVALMYRGGGCFGPYTDHRSGLEVCERRDHPLTVNRGLH